MGAILGAAGLSAAANAMSAGKIGGDQERLLAPDHATDAFLGHWRARSCWFLLAGGDGEVTATCDQGPTPIPSMADSTQPFNTDFLDPVGGSRGVRIS